jgi:hypothetical protein
VGVPREWGWRRDGWGRELGQNSKKIKIKKLNSNKSNYIRRGRNKRRLFR